MITGWCPMLVILPAVFAVMFHWLPGELVVFLPMLHCSLNGCILITANNTTLVYIRKRKGKKIDRKKCNKDCRRKKRRKRENKQKTIQKKRKGKQQYFGVNVREEKCWNGIKWNMRKTNKTTTMMKIKQKKVQTSPISNANF